MNDPIDIRSRINLVATRRAEIKARMADIKRIQSELITEFNELHSENHDLEDAERTYQKLVERKGK